MTQSQAAAFKRAKLAADEFGQAAGSLSKAMAKMARAMKGLSKGPQVQLGLQYPIDPVECEHLFAALVTGRTDDVYCPECDHQVCPSCWVFITGDPGDLCDGCVLDNIEAP